MSKAKQMAESGRFSLESEIPLKGEGYLFTVEDFEIFWSQLCKEQRELCESSLTEITGTNCKDILSWQKKIIKTAPEPKLD